ncbi:MAG: hypothetical protein EA398_15240 [Deltaproteobacteria bacterium]|nr:MAG: hypothetical protein EA398_15240 [Deltaproteobacteria bacterium]
MLRPVLLQVDNFTPPTRTPWGGRWIVDQLKRDLLIPVVREELGVVGEAWEFSVEPSFPSRTASGNLLADLIAADPVGWLGEPAVRRFGPQTPLLVKLLDASANLSVQVHPDPDDPALPPEQSGKPEAWLILHAAPGAGIWLGFRDGVTRAEVRRTIVEGGRVDELMNFIPVQAGDGFVIRPGTVHAIGAGVSLIEPQFVQAGRRGVTWRFWDWNRRYDAEGNEDEAGQPRPLHLDRSLSVATLDGATGEAFVQSCRAGEVVLHHGALATRRLCEEPWFRVDVLEGTGDAALDDAPGVQAITCTRGFARLSWDGGAIDLPAGRTAGVPAAGPEVTLLQEDAQVVRTMDGTLVA